MQNPSATSRLASFHVQRLGFRVVLGLCQGDTLSV